MIQTLSKKKNSPDLQNQPKIEKLTKIINEISEVNNKSINPSKIKTRNESSLSQIQNIEKLKESYFQQSLSNLTPKNLYTNPKKQKIEHNQSIEIINTP